ncbi:YheC/YheD family protein [Halalkalibacter alkaliphilus]|uniref:YheC/YheD family protein n=1 Tax=Halalkalibacter alkaliphilus TaxID=2917993 RepID=A0A9X2I855_9BACI|nr:YheC/YheD family protein [Halalkalibacter alkaliphilus]MCL7748674.1 YheC/YheD family protein [Halalkalibacter alkaliphilus]
MKKNKLKEFRWMKKSELLIPHLPETRLMKESTLWEMIAKYKEVILKPVKGKRGKGIIMVSSSEIEKYEIHIENKIEVALGKKETLLKLKKLMGTTPYIIQQRIPLATIDGCPIDFRVIVQRKNVSTPWKITGKVAKIAGKGYIVTNISRSQGKVMHVREAIPQSTIQTMSVDTLISDMEKIVLEATKILTEQYPKHRMYGFDMGIDSNGKLWIIEANYWPMLAQFRMLGDKQMLRRILRYKKGSKL